MRAELELYDLDVIVEGRVRKDVAQDSCVDEYR
jgi:hypothetical protein